jgi:hypothetical protein
LKPPLFGIICALLWAGVAHALGAKSLELAVAEADLIVIAKVVGFPRYEKDCRLADLKVLRSLKGESKEQVEVCLLHGNGDLEPVIGATVIAILEGPMDRVRPGAWRMAGRQLWPVTGERGSEVVSFGRTDGGVLDSVVFGRDTAADYPTQAFPLSEFETALNERMRRPNAAVYRMFSDDCPRRCRLDDWLPTVGRQSTDCSSAGTDGGRGIGRCATETKGSVHFRTSGAGIDMFFDAFVHRAGEGPWKVTQYDSDIGGGVNVCMGAVFEWSCDDAGLNEHLACKNEPKTHKSLCREDSFSVRRLSPPQSASQLRCQERGGNSFACFNGGSKGHPLKNGTALMCRKALFTEADLECSLEIAGEPIQGVDAGRSEAKRGKK